jgi:hypothetical protein
MEIVSKTHEIGDLRVRFKRLGAIASIRLNQAITEAQEAGDQMRVFELSIDAMTKCIHSIEGVTLDGQPMPWPAEQAARAEFLEGLGVDAVIALINAATAEVTPSMVTLGK